MCPGTEAIEVRDSGYSFDYNRQSVYDVGVTATDGACGRVDKTTVAVRLLDYNNLPPVFPQRTYTAEVREDAQVITYPPAAPPCLPRQPFARCFILPCIQYPSPSLSLYLS